MEHNVPCQAIKNYLFYYFIMNKFSQRLKEVRLEKGITRREMAKVLNVSERLISYWENDKRECDFDTLLKLSKYLGESIDYLLGNIDF